MKVVLLKDIKGTGKAGQVVEVSNGYAQNYLLPNKLARIGDNSALNEAKNAQVAKDYHEEQLRLAAVDTAQKLKGYTATIAVKCGSEGRLFGAVTNAEVARAISRDMGIDIDKKKISIEQVKVLGNYTAKLKLHPTVSLNIAVRVIASN